jgi:crossover junction endodeoxyribonuclease RusA
VTITVVGQPAPAGSKRYVGQSKAGRGIMIESSKAVKPWREAVKAAALEAMAGRPVMEGPLRAAMIFTLPRPKSAKKASDTPCRKPDLSKLVRSTEDALTDAGVWADDARVVTLVARKCYPGQHERAQALPGAWIEVHEAE